MAEKKFFAKVNGIAPVSSKKCGTRSALKRGPEGEIPKPLCDENTINYTI